MRTVTMNIGDPAYGVTMRVSEENLAVVLDALTGRVDGGVVEIKITEPLMILLEDGTFAPTQ
jgi:hypothetical protein